MTSKFERFVALRYLKSPRQEGFVSILAGFSFVGISLGVATLIIVMAVMNGFRHELVKKITGLNGDVAIQGIANPIDNYNPLAEKVQSLKDVKAAIPMVQRQAILMKGADAKGVVIRGMEYAAFQKLPMVSDKTVHGVLDKALTGKGKIAVGRRMAEKLFLKVGDKVVLMSPAGQVTAFGTMPRQAPFEVAAIFEIGMHNYDSSFIFMPLQDAQKFFSLPNQVTTVEVFLNKGVEIGSMGPFIKQAAGPDLQVLGWEHTNQPLFNALEVERNVMFLILTLIILIAAFNIISGLVMLVKDKTKDIAILRTMGARRRQIWGIFFLNGMTIGVVGTVLGVIMGLGFSLNIESIRQWLQTLTGTELFSAEIYFLSQLPAKVEWAEVQAIVMMSLLLSFVATLYPALKASKQDPAETLRQ